MLGSPPTGVDFTWHSGGVYEAAFIGDVNTERRKQVIAHFNEEFSHKGWPSS